MEETLASRLSGHNEIEAALAVRECHTRYERRVTGLLRSKLGLRREDAEEIWQDTLTAVWEKRKGVSGNDERVAAFIRKIAYRRGIDRRRLKLEKPDPLPSDVTSKDLSAYEQVVAKLEPAAPSPPSEQIQLARELLKQMKPKLRDFVKDHRNPLNKDESCGPDVAADHGYTDNAAKVANNRVRKNGAKFMSEHGFTKPENDGGTANV